MIDAHGAHWQPAATRSPLPWRDWESCRSYANEHQCSIPEAQDALFREANPMYKVNPFILVKTGIPMTGWRWGDTAHSRIPEASYTDATAATAAAVHDFRGAVKRRYLVAQCTGGVSENSLTGWEGGPPSRVLP